MPLQILRYEVTFLTPAFLGNAKQSGQWRTPPFKAALRQWWRVVWASRKGFSSDQESMRLAEARLFGAATGTSAGAGSKSGLRLRLQHWHEGLDQMPNWGSPNLLYLGYGPLEQKGKGVALKRGPAIKAGEKVSLAIALPADDLEVVRDTLALFGQYGTLGGRSRNGWGSVELTDVSNPSSMSRPPSRCQRDWRKALDRDWPHAIGHDDGKALIWATKKRHQDWSRVMATLSEVRKSVRDTFKFSSLASPQPGHWLAYPVTKHGVPDWKSKRLPNSLRFKVRRNKDNPDQCEGIVFHMPCMPPCGFNPREDEIKKVWQRVHQSLDHNPRLERISA